MATRISSVLIDCLKLFKGLISHPELKSYAGEVPPSLWADELGRLRVWAANIGAHQTGQTSLDYRLRDASHITEQTIKLLERLRRTLQDADEYLAGTDAEDTEDLSVDGDEGTELQQIHQGLVNTIDCLFQLSMIIRRPAQHDRLLGINKLDATIFETFDQQHVAHKYPHAGGLLINRLGVAISRRRAALKYRERHHAKLGKGIDRAALDERSEHHDAASTLLSGTFATDFVEPHIEFEETSSTSGASQTSYASSLWESEDRITFPRPPKESANGKPFECPYCFFILKISNRKSWIEHVFKDLMPYVCVFEDCSTPSRLYESRREWFQHLKSRHLPVCAPSDERDCPLKCGATLPPMSLESHLGRHMVELALFALPRAEEGSEEDSAPPEISLVDDLDKVSHTSSDEEQVTPPWRSGEHFKDDRRQGFSKGKDLEDRLLDISQDENSEEEIAESEFGETGYGTENLDNVLSVQGRKGDSAFEYSEDEPQQISFSMDSGGSDLDQDPYREHTSKLSETSQGKWSRETRTGSYLPFDTFDPDAMDSLGEPIKSGQENKVMSKPQSSFASVAPVPQNPVKDQVDESTSPDTSAKASGQSLLSTLSSRARGAMGGIASWAEVVFDKATKRNFIQESMKPMETNPTDATFEEQRSAKPASPRPELEFPVSSSSRTLPEQQLSGNTIYPPDSSLSNSNFQASSEARNSSIIIDEEESGTISFPRVTSRAAAEDKIHSIHDGRKSATVVYYPSRESYTAHPKGIRRQEARIVDFAAEPMYCRDPRDDELGVMEHFAKHAAKCEYCHDPYEAYRQDRPLCSKGLSYAKDVAVYLYAKNGKAFSRIDRANGERVQVQIPADCGVVGLLIKAFDRGMKLDRTRVPVNERRRERIYDGPPEKEDLQRRRERRELSDDYDVVEIIPHSSRHRRLETDYRF
ncbi:uncharacterized protein PV07_00106 [Cladophialophora immunda]|uniref:Oxidoreductase acuF-like C2H2 type zinc-finger domain-containing protein n=1 Tax=Cladophialophora immunda TaxID=569365 RepID=A0A0D2CTI6_9EURO|nr:uncharacterized protein PV07_00106 [Cladophialophora immunda]KIW33240.1 hypothetical protein PV07_00106 [Cladophialophora immunda]OQV00035.1 hypothetical protein CLAIMM_05589 [Cladophialophora immunda]